MVMTSIPTTIPNECNATTETSRQTLIQTWNHGKCLLGASKKLWNIHPDGTASTTNDALRCDPTSEFGTLTCEHFSHKWNAPHLVLTPALSVRDAQQLKQLHHDLPTLVLFLPGTGRPPSDYSRLLRAAAESGHYVIGLSYLWEPVAVSQMNAWCLFEPDPARCNSELHSFMLFGTSPFKSDKRNGLWDVAPVNSVVHLTVDVLSQLPWGNKFLTKAGEVDWARVVISGHSQGAGHATYLSVKKNTSAVLFSGPQDCEPCITPWLHAEASSGHNVRRLGMFHVHEECALDPLFPQTYCARGLLFKNWHTLGVGPDDFCLWSGDRGLKEDALDGCKVLVSLEAPKCEEGRVFHTSIAADQCAKKVNSAEWKWLFSEVRGGDDGRVQHGGMVRNDKWIAKEMRSGRKEHGVRLGGFELGKVVGILVWVVILVVSRVLKRRWQWYNKGNELEPLVKR